MWTTSLLISDISEYHDKEVSNETSIHGKFLPQEKCPTSDIDIFSICSKAVLKVLPHKKWRKIDSSVLSCWCPQSLQILLCMGCVLNGTSRLKDTFSAEFLQLNFHPEDCHMSLEWKSLGLLRLCIGRLQGHISSISPQARTGFDATGKYWSKQRGTEI